MSNRVAVPFSLAVIEIAWLTPWSFLAGNGTTGTPLLPPPLMFLILVVAASLTARTVAPEAPSPRTRLILIAAGALIALTATVFAPDTRAGWPASLASDAGSILSRGVSFHLLALLGAAGLWWRGIVLARGRPGDRGTGGRVGVGVAGLAVAAVAGEGPAAPLAQETLSLAVIAFLFAALLASTLSDLEAVRAGSRDRQARALSRSWLRLVAGMACGLLAVGVAAAGLAERQGLRVLHAAANLLAPALDFLLMAIALPFALVADLLYHLFLLIRPGQHPPPAPQIGRSPFANLQQPGATPAPEWVFRGGGIALALLAVLVVLLLFWAAMQRFRGPPDEADVPEERRSVWSWSDLRSPFRRGSALGATSADEAVDAVRAAYRRFLTLEAQRGWARHAPETPLEYRRRLQSEPHIDRAALEQLSACYERMRYGAQRATPADGATAEASLARLREGYQADDAKDAPQLSI